MYIKNGASIARSPAKMTENNIGRGGDQERKRNTFGDTVGFFQRWRGRQQSAVFPPKHYRLLFPLADHLLGDSFRRSQKIPFAKASYDPFFSTQHRIRNLHNACAQRLLA